MANCCFTEYAIYIAPDAAGGSGDLERLHASFLRNSEKCFSTLTALMRSEHVSPEKLAAAAGQDLQESDIAWHFDSGNAIPCLRLSCVSAWAPKERVWETFLRENYPGLSLAWTCAEDGQELYLRHDPTGILFPSRCILDCGGVLLRDGAYFEGFFSFPSEEALLVFARERLQLPVFTGEELMAALEDLSETTGEVCEVHWMREV